MAKKKKYTCPDCGGSGGKTDVILDDGTGPWEECGWCEGKGKITGKRLAEWLNWKKVERLEDAENIISMALSFLVQQGVDLPEIKKTPLWSHIVDAARRYRRKHKLEIHVWGPEKGRDT